MKKKEELETKINSEQEVINVNVENTPETEVTNVETEVTNVETEVEQNNIEPFVSFIAKVTECSKLNVRKEPSKDAEVLCVIDNGSEVEVVDNSVEEDFYKVVLPNGLEGYCMKKYITSK